MARYFAYGSNMWSERLIARVPEARALGAATLFDYRFCCNKRGKDGSAKANIEVAPGDRVPGVLFEMGEYALAVLDRFEGGYRRDRVRVAGAGGSAHAFTYLGIRLDETLYPTAEYRDFMVKGAQEHQLPADWIAYLKALRVG